MEQDGLEHELLELFDSLLIALEQSKEFKEEEISSRLIFDMYKMWKSNSSRKFSESATWLDQDTANVLLQQGLAQKIILDEGEKYALTFRGIAKCINIRYGVTLEDQFLKFLELADQGFNTEAQTPLTWREKLASLSLVLLASTSNSAAIRLNNDTNKIALAEVLQRTLVCLKKADAIDEREELTTVKRGENPASALMCRVDTLARKTRQYYKYTGHSEYFLDIERDGDIDEIRLSFLLGKIFEKYDPECDYRELYKELARISQLHYPRFLGRSVNTTIVLSILAKLRSFLEEQILRLPHRFGSSPRKAPNAKTMQATLKQTEPQARAETFWPAVRQRMKEKAEEFYAKDHPEARTTPGMKELRKAGYLHTAKIFTLREIQAARKATSAKR